MKTLMVFDFDDTLIDDNSDTWVVRCLPDQTLPYFVENTYRKGHWTEFMGRVMHYIGDQEVSPERIRNVMETIPLTPGMTDLLRFIIENKNTIDCIVLSDSNTMFINWILHSSGLQAAVDQVFSNPAKFNDNGYMEVQPYHSHDCSRCPVNLCKRKVLELFLSEKSNGGVDYERVFYVGDGGNDLCPTSCLRGQDVVMPRKGYTLEKMIGKLKAQEENSSLKARVVSWRCGTDILQEVRASTQS
ncbi:pyridoxal phosphate phosphatase PHOSPHO2 [Betta splendens]|uniref:Pyridoxal phosphate phosphatase PHOSPHO2 n=1 Tax=Betta splendens TaxID=158456 RepID=A0A6P7M1V5_BETSP|nr:pyridoxal phosphate phosphatase PHOSPHO2 [Betta splendens]XP_029000523.1 pyridoxal phosphate phosphatase PHOSPHO2 [Betta splendens]XP_029000524.1 pyridoxal phosphate phosphatase PHOSPHO2 [Betta splendens]XP_040925992.1 pyridoxal phosphate phosphatase PHOSPHO2 [Betta splendens]